MARFYMYDNSGNISDTMKDISDNPVTYSSLADALYALYDREKDIPGRYPHGIHDLSVRWYAFDTRLNKHVYIITHMFGYFKKFLIDLDD